MRSLEWQQLITELCADPAEKIDHLAFVLMMVKLGGCLGCNADSYRAIRGCTVCAKQTVRRFRGSDIELIEQFNQSRREMQTYLKKHSSVGKN
jgi:radical SAM superfamily enzyme